ncbi:hypothetical protein PIB30_001930 [Stylosanthes scabra]|uniref:Legume lectin domain-containing protein n=1 Tax=Stylosanthes scabra TaxID=79078 RepID=A0ABU6Y1Q9_9FABA|nr:hypothetical protein [Stylosanthes scabra]
MPDNFVTTFTLQTIDIPDYAPADGIVFFIAPQDTQIPADGVGGALGVASLTTGAGEFVGVEFDNYVNGEYNDPPYSQVGIDLNSVVSSKTVEWNRESGTVVNVTVIYDSSSNTLSVAVRNSRNGEIVAISQVVDLKEKLPPRVKFGFSAASSSGGRQYHLAASLAAHSITARILPAVILFPFLRLSLRVSPLSSVALLPVAEL